MPPSHIEREYKFRAAAPLVVDHVDALLTDRAMRVGGGAHEDTYFDDAEGTLLRHGIGLRTRRLAGRTLICCKHDGERDGAMHVRAEIELPWTADGGPASAADLPPPIRAEVEPFACRRPLQPVATLVVQRQIRQLIDGARVLGELAIDAVAVRAGGAEASFGELELEVGDDAEVCAALAERLARELPVEVAADTKVEHALRLVGLAAAPAPATPPGTVAELLSHGIAVHLAGIGSADAGLRRDGGADHVHTLRVHLRRLRSLLAGCGDALRQEDAEWASGFVAAWNRSLGELRDVDVALLELEGLVAEVPVALRPAAERLHASQQEAREQALARLLALHAGDEHLDSRDRLHRLARGSAGLPPAASTPAGEHAREQLWRAARRVKKRAHELGDDPPLAALHELRLAVKRLRYFAEECREVFGPLRPRVLRRLLRAQVRLGAVCDHAAGVSRWLDQLAPNNGATGSSPTQAALLGACAALQFARQQAALRPALRAVKRLDRRATWAQFHRK